MELAFYGIIAIACLIALHDWRWGLYAGIVVDVLRDPVRKMTDEQSVAITLAGAAVWGVLLLRCLTSEQTEVAKLFQRYPHLRTVLLCLLLAIVPAAGLSCLLYPQGYLLAAIGVVSYLAPLLGIGMGFVFVRSEQAVYRLFSFYSVVNSIALIGVPLEYVDAAVPGLGGIEVEWIRYRTGYTVDLISGFYRSPDIMGLHAAHVITFSILLALRTRSSGSQIGWSALVLWAAYCVVLSGRRKMIGIPLVFLAVYVGLGMWRGMRRVRRAVGIVSIAGLLAGAIVFFFWQTEASDHHLKYATTVVTESPTRMNDLVIGSTITTLQQVGVLGAGLGTATQGRYYLGIETGRRTRGWQEDGVSKLLLEFGVPGLLLVTLAGLLLIACMFRAMQMIPPQSSTQALQVGVMAVVLGDAASFVISHQQLSGDPVSALLITMMVGIVLGSPRLHAAQNWARRATFRRADASTKQVSDLAPALRRPV